MRRGHEGSGRGMRTGPEAEESGRGKRRVRRGEEKQGLFDEQMRQGAEGRRSYIRVGADGKLETNLSPSQLRTILRLAKLELEDLRDTLQPHRIKVIGELLDMVETAEKRR